VLEELTAFTPLRKQLNVCIVPIIQDTQVEGASEFVLVIHDVSQLRKLEQMRAEFVANVSHELRTPLTSIQGYAETLLDGALEDEDNARQFVLTIQRQAQRLAALISDLLELSKIESGQVQLNLAPQDLNKLVQNVLNIFEPDCSEKGLKFTSEIPEDIPEVSADERLLTQVLINLLDNAIKYTEEGAQITVSAKTLDLEIQVDVRDTGIGIREIDIDRIFERFYRVDKSRSRELGESGLRSKVLRSTGLGLSIVKHIIQQHGGKIWVESQLGQGSTFSFALPKASKSHP
jgi:two-component system phosphate regulon sensor histidine kinase PhoR